MPVSEIDEETGKADMRVIALAWTKCRSRKRLIKLLGGAIGIQRNDAAEFIKAAMEAGCSSYQQLWDDTLTYFLTELIHGILDNKMPVKATEIFMEVTDNDHD